MLCSLHWKCYFSSTLFQEWLIFKDFCSRFKSHFRLFQMTSESINFVQNHQVTAHFTMIIPILTMFFILLVREQNFAILSISWYKDWSDLNFTPDILVSYVVFEIYWVHIISLWKFGLVAYGLIPLWIWSFTFWSDQPFVTEIPKLYFLSYGVSNG